MENLQPENNSNSEIKPIWFLFALGLCSCLSGCVNTEKLAAIESNNKQDQKLSTQELDEKYSVLLGQVVQFIPNKDRDDLSKIGVKSLLVYPASSLKEQFYQLRECNKERLELLKKKVLSECLRSKVLPDILFPLDPQPKYKIIPVKP